MNFIVIIILKAMIIIIGIMSCPEIAMEYWSLHMSRHTTSTSNKKFSIKIG